MNPVDTVNRVASSPMPATCRCPRCAYPLTGLPGAPLAADPYGPFPADERCPECALVIPRGAHCVVGGASADVVDEGGAWSVTAIAIGAAILIGGPWICIIFGVVIIQAIQNGGFSRGIRFTPGPGGYGPGLLIAGVVLTFAFAAVWLALRSWRRASADDGTGTRAGALRRRAMVVPGGLHLWTGDPSATAASRSLAGGDIRDVRGRRHIPLFRKKGAAEVGAIDFVTPLVLWSQQDLKRSSQSGSGILEGTVWVQLPAGQAADAAARALERTLRAAPATAPVALESVTLGAQPTPLVDGDPNRLAVPVAITAATAGEPPTCPRCSHALPDVPPGPWWEPLPTPVTCPSCQLAVPAGAIVISGWRHAGEAQWRGARSGRAALGIVGIVFAILSLIALVIVLRQVSPVASILLQVATMVATPLGIVLLSRRYARPIPRPRERFQPGTMTWIVAPGELRIVTRARRAAAVNIVPARGIGRFSFTNSQGADTTAPVQTDTLTVRGTAQQLGLIGEMHLHVPMPAELDQDVLLDALRKAIVQGK